MSLPSYELEVRASEQRKRIHLSLKELKSAVRERTAIKPALTKYLPRFAAGAAVCGLLAGYRTGGMREHGKRR